MKAESDSRDRISQIPPRESPHPGLKRCRIRGEGNSIRATARLTGTSKNTVAGLLKIVGVHCRFTRDVTYKRVQIFEIWPFCGAKEKNVKPEKKVEGWGAPTCNEFVEDLEDRLSNRVQLTSDGLKLYLGAVEDAFGWAKVGYAQLVKVYGPGPDLERSRRYSPAVYVSAQKVPVMGKPDRADITTSHVERQNLTMRMHMRRFTRLTNALSKKVEYHLYAVALHATFYNYVRPHSTLTKKRGGVKTTPAMAAGLAKRPWTVYDLLDLLDGR